MRFIFIREYKKKKTIKFVKKYASTAQNMLYFVVYED